MKRLGLISTAALFLLLGNTAPADAQPGQEKDRKQEKHGRDKKQHGKHERQQQAPQAQEQQAQNSQPHQRVQPQEEDKQHGRQRAQQVHDRNAQRQQQRISQQEQEQRIELQQRNLTVYRQSLDQRIRLAPPQTAQLQQRRPAQYGFQQDYYRRLRQQQLRLQNERNYNYSNDPYYYTGWTHRYNRGGTSYQTNQYGADLLRHAVNNGYQEGFHGGQADRQDRWRSNYQDSYAYQDANYGYGGRYVQQDEYNYYFRQGFSRGYEDGFNSRSQYGSYSNGKYSMLSAILGGILNLESLR
jgi:hypothetical protein